MNTRHRSGFLVCGKELIYLDSPEPGTCAICGTIRETDARTGTWSATGAMPSLPKT